MLEGAVFTFTHAKLSTSSKEIPSKSTTYSTTTRTLIANVMPSSNNEKLACREPNSTIYRLSIPRANIRPTYLLAADYKKLKEDAALLNCKGLSSSPPRTLHHNQCHNPDKHLGRGHGTCRRRLGGQPRVCRSFPAGRRVSVRVEDVVVRCAG